MTVKIFQFLITTYQHQYANLPPELQRLLGDVPPSPQRRGRHGRAHQPNLVPLAMLQDNDIHVPIQLPDLDVPVLPLPEPPPAAELN